MIGLATAFTLYIIHNVGIFGPLTLCRGITIKKNESIGDFLTVAMGGTYVVCLKSSVNGPRKQTKQ
jgi:hypothetical protein